MLYPLIGSLPVLPVVIYVQKQKPHVLEAEHAFLPPALPASACFRLVPEVLLSPPYRGRDTCGFDWELCPRALHLPPRCRRSLGTVGFLSGAGQRLRPGTSLRRAVLGAARPDTNNLAPASHPLASASLQPSICDPAGRGAVCKAAGSPKCWAQPGDEGGSQGRAVP